MNFTKLTRYLDNIDKNMVPSCRLIVKQGHETVFSYFNARDDIYESEKDRELYYLFSASKVITCTAVMRLVEEGKLSLDDPVYKYLPEFKTLYIGGTAKECHKEIDPVVMPKAENTLLIKHLLSMQGGYTYDLGHPEIQKVIKDTEGMATTRQIATAISKMPLLFEPGEGFNYSLCHDILGAVAEVVTGLSFFEYLDKLIFTPLAMKNTFFQPDEAALSRMHRQFAVKPGLFMGIEQAPSCSFALSKKHESGGAGLVSSAEDYSKFISCLASGASPAGYTLLKPETVDLMRACHLSDAAREATKDWKPGYTYGLGVRVLVDKERAHSLSPVGEFGWDGAAGAYTLIDTENRISLIYTQHVHGCGYCYSHIHPTVRNLVYEGFDIK